MEHQHPLQGHEVCLSLKIKSNSRSNFYRRFQLEFLKSAKVCDSYVGICVVNV